MTPQAPDGALSRARALGGRSRAEIHRLVAASDHPMTIGELASATGLHRTAVRLHLVQLAEAGLVEAATLPPTGRGRPRSVYRAVDAQPYLTLASWLAEGVRTGRSAREMGRVIGERTARVGVLDVVGCIVDEASRIGFDPVVRSDPSTESVEVVLRSCPFAELAVVDPATVCALHLGLAEGVAGAIGGAVVDRLDVVDPRHDQCRIVVRVGERSTDRTPALTEP